MNDQSDTGNRRNISPEFISAVKGALRRNESGLDATAMASRLWTSKRISFRKPYAQEVTMNDNPHYQGGAIDCIESTISRLASK